MKKFLSVLCAAAALAACASEGAVYKPQAQIMPQHIKKIAVRQILNKTEVFALEDKFYNELYDEFLRDGSYQIVSENNGAEGVVVTTISRYLNVPIQYDSQLIPTVYRMDIWLDVVFMDKTTNAPVWREPAFLGTQIYAASTLPGGMTEVQARDVVFEKLSKDKITMGLYMKNVNKFYLLTLREDVNSILDAYNVPEELKTLDLTVLHKVILTKELGFTDEEQMSQDGIKYIKVENEAFDMIDLGKAEASFIMAYPKIEDIKRISSAGYRMPQKSTYFYPKLLSGIVINPLQN